VKEQVAFSLSGDFITSLARDWLYAEKRPYKKVMDLLLACLCGSDYSELQLEEFANDILTGKRKLTGNTKDGTYGLVDDNTNIIAMYPLYFQRLYKKQNKPTNKTTGEFFANTKKFNLRRPADIIYEDDIDTHTYGWLNPSGVFYPVEINHERWAADYVHKHLGKDYYSEIRYGFGDYLEKRGWLLLHNPMGGRAEINQCYRRLTKKQKEFLYDYFAKDGDIETAKAVLEM